jgi:hypothetical protein
MNKEQLELLDEVYENWCKQFEVDINNFDAEELVKGHGDQCWGYPILDHVKPTSKEYKRGQINAYLEGKADRPFFYLSKDEFINKCKTDTEFSERWELKIEERELDMMERWAIADLTPNMEEFDFANYMCDKHNVPTNLITITYNDKTIESYE